MCYDIYVWVSSICGKSGLGKIIKMQWKLIHEKILKIFTFRKFLWMIIKLPRNMDFMHTVKGALLKELEKCGKT